MFAMGGGVRGGTIYGDWPGLEKEQLYEGRDLDLTTDFRAVLGELVPTHLQPRLVHGLPGLRGRSGEIPDADPHVRWCGRGCKVPIPIRRHERGGASD